MQQILSKDQTQSENVSSRRDFLKQLGVAGTLMAFGGETTLLSSTAQLSAEISAVTASPPSVALIALNRMGFGPRLGDIAAFEALGGNDVDRMNAYVDQQINPDTIDDSAFDALYAQFNPQTLSKSQSQLWQDHIVADPQWNIRMLPFYEVERMTFLRAMYSKKQLVEVLADFWHNHFNVYAYEYYIGPTWPYYDREVIRNNIFGNFRDMLGLVAKSSAMLYYLDNAGNRVAGPNENYARELFELHTLGAENYLGVMPQGDVPLEDGVPVGYVDGDVYEATRCFTGWTVNNRNEYTPVGNTGEVYYRGDWHDRFQKYVLGQWVPADQTVQQDGEAVLDRVAYHKGTSRYIARKLCRRLISDNPPEPLIQSAADIFYNQRFASDQLKQVVEHILKSTEFRTTWGEKVKRPFEYVVSACRALDSNLVIKTYDSPSDSFMWNYSRSSQKLFQWQAPDGYPDGKDAWLSSMSLVMNWRMVKWFVGASHNDIYHADIVGQTPTNLQTATELADFWIDRLIHRTLDANIRQEIIDFMAQDEGADTPLPVFQESWPGPNYRNRLRVMVALILQIPAFHEK